MIGNTIEFLHYEFGNHSDYERNKTREQRLKTGLVVDAYTDVFGKIEGNSEVFLGFGGGKTVGTTNSKRKYKVQFTETYSKDPKFCDIHDWQLVKILSFANSSTQEIYEEKIQIR